MNVTCLNVSLRDAFPGKSLTPPGAVSASPFLSAEPPAAGLVHVSTATVDHGASASVPQSLGVSREKERERETTVGPLQCSALHAARFTEALLRILR